MAISLHQLRDSEDLQKLVESMSKLEIVWQYDENNDLTLCPNPIVGKYFGVSENGEDLVLLTPTSKT